MKPKLSIILILLLYFSVHGQNWKVEICGTITERNVEPLENVSVIFLENADTLGALITDVHGKYFFEATFSVQSEYSVHLIYNKTHYGKTILHEIGDTLFMDTYELDVSILTKREEHFGPGAYYDLNDVKHMQNFESDWLKSIMQDYPEMCVQFIQILNPKESKGIAKRRLKNFKKELAKINCDMQRISYSSHAKYLSDDLLAIDSRSRIQGFVISIDGDCK